MNRNKEIRQRLESATPGPWEADVYGEYVWEAKHKSDGSMIAEMRGWGHLTGTQKLDDEAAAQVQLANAEFIANAPSDIAYLLERVEQLEKERNSAIYQMRGSDNPCQFCYYAVDGEQVFCLDCDVEIDDPDHDCGEKCKWFGDPCGLCEHSEQHMGYIENFKWCGLPEEVE